MHFMAEAAQIAVVAFALQEMPANGPAHGDKNLWHTRKPRKLSPASLVVTFFKHIFLMCICGMSQDAQGGVCACLSLSLHKLRQPFAIQERRTKLATPVKIEMIDKSFNIS
jgi:hypothetical protein